MNLYLLKYNNYYNRIAKIENTLEDYLQTDDRGNYLYLLGGEPLTKINFNPNDGVSTNQVINWNFNIPDYIVAVDEHGSINSRWFVIEAKRERLNQFNLSLKRDLIADYFEAVIKSPFYIQKAMVNTGSPFIFNSEGMAFNQIKSDEFELKDPSDSRWIIGYVATNGFDTYTPEGGDPIQPGEIVAQPKVLAQDTILDYDTIKSYVGKNITNTGSTSSNTQFSIFYNYQYNAYDTNTREDKFDFQNRYLTTVEHGDTGKQYRQYVNYNSSVFDNTQSAIGKQEAVERAFNSYGNTLKGAIEAAVGTLPSENTVALDQTDIDELLANQNKTLKDANGNIFVYSIEKNVSVSKKFTLTKTNGGSLWNAYYAWMEVANEDHAYGVDTYFDDVGFEGRTTYESYTLTLSFAPDKGYKTSLSKNSRDLLNAPYKMFAIPYDPCVFAWNPNPPDVGVPFIKRSDPTACRAIAAEIANNLSGSGTLYDIQVLPYCPVRELFEYVLVSPGTASEISPGTYFAPTAPYDPSGVVHSLIIDNTGDEEVVKGIVFFAENDSFSFTIDHEIKVPTDNIEFKVEHETSMYRLNSSNYSGSFEFKATSNRGVSGFEINCTYKPFQPYIHVNPIFNEGGLYGKDYNDARGLICSGDFTFPTTSEAWQTYQIQNKSYYDAHTRQIENMETTYEYNREIQMTTGITGAIQSAITGGISGSLIGKGIGAGIGGILGGLTSAIGAAKDLEYSDKIFAESKAYAKDQFNLNLRNIKAQPYTLGRVGGLTINSKMFPFVEYYTATNTEKEAFRKKLKYNSMTINAIGTIEDYKIKEEKTFIQGQCIRMEGIDDDYHVAAELALEINKGYYI